MPNEKKFEEEKEETKYEIEEINNRINFIDKDKYFSIQIILENLGLIKNEIKIKLIISNEESDEIIKIIEEDYSEIKEFKETIKINKKKFPSGRYKAQLLLYSGEKLVSTSNLIQFSIKDNSKEIKQLIKKEKTTKTPKNPLEFNSSNFFFSLIISLLILYYFIKKKKA